MPQKAISTPKNVEGFYRTRTLRPGDPFAAMERHSMAERQIALHRKIEAFAALMRPGDALSPTRFAYPVAGPACHNHRALS